MYSALDVARYIIWYCKQSNYVISNLKLQKILYFVQADFLVNRGTPCFYEEIEAWDFGPVVPEVYHEFKIFGSSDIPASVCKGAEYMIIRSDRKMIDDMVDECAQYTASYLVDVTHSQYPWKKAYRRGFNNIIKNSCIKAYFSK